MEKIVVYRCKIYWYDAFNDTGDTENLIIIGINKESIDLLINDTNKAANCNRGDSLEYDLRLKKKYFFRAEEVAERFNLSESQIDKILSGENLKLDDLYLDDTDYLSDLKLSIEEIREKRIIDSEPFDVEEIVYKISKGYLITPKRKKDLLACIKKLL